MSETEWPDKCANCGSEELIHPEIVYIDHGVTTTELQIECHNCDVIAYVVLNISLKSVEWKGGKKPNTDQP